MIFTYPSSVRLVTSGFYDTRDWGQHAATDFACPYSTPIVASAPGVVRFADWAGNAGRMVEITHEGGWLTRYVHLSKFLCKVGDTLGRGEALGLSGASGFGQDDYYGAHLHFAAWVDNHATALTVQPDPYKTLGNYWAINPESVLEEPEEAFMAALTDAEQTDLYDRVKRMTNENDNLIIAYAARAVRVFGEAAGKTYASTGDIGKAFTAGAKAAAVIEIEQAAIAEAEKGT